MDETGAKLTTHGIEQHRVLPDGITDQSNRSSVRAMIGSLDFILIGQLTYFLY